MSALVNDALQGSWTFKALVVDDASTDRTTKIIQRYNDPRLEVIRLAKNVGAAAAINHAFGAIGSEFVCGMHRAVIEQPCVLIRRKVGKGAFCIAILDYWLDGTAMTG